MKNTGPCQDTATILVPDSKAIECHPQASITAAPVGSGHALVVCRCNILPAPNCGPASCELSAHDAGDEQ